MCKALKYQLNHGKYSWFNIEKCDFQKNESLRWFIVLNDGVHKKSEYTKNVFPIMLGSIKTKGSESWKSQGIIEMKQWKLKT